ncbi:MAG: NAD(P)H-binding protein [Cyclobacteriaceae bacterium]
MAKVALLVGTTGLIGSQLLDLLLESNDYEKVIALSRKPLDKTHPNLNNLVCELNQLQNHATELKADDVFCCLGTTMKKAKTKEAFRAVDYDAPLAMAKIAKENGAKKYLIISALGANKDSSIFYNKVKGEVEEAIAQIGFDSFHIFQPSLLTGPRKEQRTGEEAAQVFYKIFGFLIPKKYASIESIKVARAMMALAKEERKGRVVHSSSELQEY